ncbi:MAG TPA: CDP-diacylglycerol--serine O-phosphatidyltransferase [Bacteroidota bacterium]|nr:CDP-diacylglycerol--serine O-phosphatidyltransferase [Bacteroidota bacterium]
MRIRLSRSIVPNLFTVLNIFFGFLSMIHAVQGMFIPAVWYILLSALCDTLDGFMARLTKSASEFGVELDSLADVVSFGAAPSFLLYMLLFKDAGNFGALVAASPLIMGALRLARFNVQLVGFSKEYFTGMPIPLSALTLTSFILLFTPERIMVEPLLRIALTVLTIACAILMVSTIRYPVIPRIGPRLLRERPVLSILALLVAVAVLVSLGRLLFPALMLIVLSGPLFALGRLLRRMGGGPPSPRRDERELDSTPDASHATIDSH